MIPERTYETITDFCTVKFFFGDREASVRIQRMPWIPGMLLR